jgi:hypothetical protein
MNLQYGQELADMACLHSAQWWPGAGGGVISVSVKKNALWVVWLVWPAVCDNSWDVNMGITNMQVARVAEERTPQGSEQAYATGITT